MKKILSLFLVMFLLLGAFPIVAMAEENESFFFELSIDGSDTKEVQTGDVITVVFRLKRTDAEQSYTMYAMQNEIRYDSTFFELVEGSAVLGSDINTTDIGMRDNYREFYMNFLSTNGGVTWESDTLVGSFQLKVIAQSGVTKITSEDYLVSVQDGSESYVCNANALTVILSTECTVRFESNGGTEIEDQMVRYGEKIVKPEDPVRDGYTFDGWFADLDRTTRWDFDNDTVTGNTTLYAGWSKAEAEPIAPTPTDDSTGEDMILWCLLGALLLLLLLLLIFFPRKKITFNTMGGSEIKSKHVRKNSKLKAPKPSRKYRHVFAGWYKDESCTIPWDFDADKVTEDIILYAKWI